MDSLSFEPPEWGSSPWDQWLEAYLATDPFYLYAANDLKQRLLRLFYKRTMWTPPSERSK